LYILITRFEDYINKTETTCFGRSLRDRIDVKANKNHTPIKICYSDKFSPQTVTDVKALQKKYNADLVLWGRLKNVLKDCSEGDFCFLSQPSDTLIRLVGGELEVEQMDLRYEQKISPSKIEQGEFHVDSLSFDHWLTAIYNIKIGRNNPDLYLIDKDLTLKEQAGQYKQRGKLFFNLHKYSEAIMDYNRAIGLNSNDSKVYIDRGFAKEGSEDYKGAILDYNKAIQLNPNESMTYSFRGNTKGYYLQDYEGAILDFNKSIELNPNVSSVYYIRGLAKAISENCKGAIIDFNKAIQLKPDDSEAYNYRGLAKNNLYDYEGAILDYNKAIQLKPDYSEAYNNRGIIKYIFLQDYKGAILDYNKAIQLKPDDSDAYYNRGLVKVELKDFKGAKADFDKAKSLGKH
jgi:tetratricopeptide (TPR) repeat protein